MFLMDLKGVELAAKRKLTHLTFDPEVSIGKKIE